ncbi:MAG TPA: hypothetical protein VFP79_03745, partial [Pseudolabrys sp.]|nr:hypothetical protein [Pseudolabrys sp.]
MNIGFPSRSRFRSTRPAAARLQAPFNNLVVAGKQHSWNAEAERLCCDPANSLKPTQAGTFWGAETDAYVMSR